MCSDLVSPHSINKLHSERLRGKQAFYSPLASNYHPTDYVQPPTRALKALVGLAQESNRKAVIINNVLYPWDSKYNSGTACTSTILGESKLKVGRKKLQKKSPSSLSIGTTISGKALPVLLPLDYLDAEKTSREAIYLHASTLKISQSTARQMQNPDASKNTWQQADAARSARICAALSSHPLMIREAFATAQRLDVPIVNIENMSPAVLKAESPQRKRYGRAQNRVKFKPVLECMEEKCENPENGHILETSTDQGSASQERLRYTHICRLGFSESKENLAGKFLRLEKERDSYFEKCESLERVLSRVYESRDFLKQELKSTKRRREGLENRIVGFRERIQILETEVTMERMRLKEEISRRQLLEANIHRLRLDNQQMKAGGAAVNAI